MDIATAIVTSIAVGATSLVVFYALERWYIGQWDHAIEIAKLEARIAKLERGENG